MNCLISAVFCMLVCIFKVSLGRWIGLRFICHFSWNSTCLYFVLNCQIKPSAFLSCKHETRQFLSSKKQLLSNSWKHSIKRKDKQKQGSHSYDCAHTVRRSQRTELKQAGLLEWVQSRFFILSFCYFAADYRKWLGQKKKSPWRTGCVVLHNASEHCIMKHMFLSGLKVCTERIKSQSYLNIQSERTCSLHRIIVGYCNDSSKMCLMADSFTFWFHMGMEPW